MRNKQKTIGNSYPGVRRLLGDTGIVKSKTKRGQKYALGNESDLYLKFLNFFTMIIHYKWSDILILSFET